ncbi:GNAT family N-acetyltransferase [Pseudonocardia sp. TRM90224]|uniref:GNAT family N-acetyltransferase n=1 Tax=Pseudonocardia sp. TRM90224 TaxID=2812678 RepID=UPI001E4468CE|nr:GNAT family N-acetyltransferase [Pseudonocardia sp. TRM90224]
MTTSALPPALRLRPLQIDDAERLASLRGAIEEVDKRGWHYDVEDCAEELADPDMDLALDTVMVLDGEEPVAYQIIYKGEGAMTGQKVMAFAAVHPERRGQGIGTALLSVAAQRAEQLNAMLTAKVPEEMADAAALFADFGMAPVRWWSELKRDLARPVAAVAVPDGLTLNPLGPEYDRDWDERLRAAHNEAFRDHWGSSPDTAEGFAHARTYSKNFRSGCSVAACDAGGAVAGYVLSYEYEADFAHTGIKELLIDTVGTVAEWRGKGVAAALLAHVLATAVEQGFEQAALTVDSQNPTGAVGVYERAGFVLRRREVTFGRSAKA